MHTEHRAVPSIPGRDDIVCAACGGLITGSIHQAQDPLSPKISLLYHPWHCPLGDRCPNPRTYGKPAREVVKVSPTTADAILDLARAVRELAQAIRGHR